MKKTGKILAALSVLWLVLCGCSNGIYDLDNIKTSAVVSSGSTYLYAKYYTDSVSDGEYMIQAYRSGSTIMFPENPSKEGFVFGGWYSDSSFTSKVFNKVTKIYSDMNLFAKFVDSSIKYTVRFLNDDGTAVTGGEYSDKLAGETVALPSAPVSTVNSDLVFVGWFPKADGSGTALTGSYTVEPQDADETTITFYAVYKTAYGDGGISIIF